MGRSTVDGLHCVAPDLELRHPDCPFGLCIARTVPVDTQHPRVVKDRAVPRDGLLCLAVLVTTEHQEWDERLHALSFAHQHSGRLDAMSSLTDGDALARIRRICIELPGTEEAELQG